MVTRNNRRIVMKVEIVREYNISYGKDYDLVEIAEIYIMHKKPVAREDKTYYGQVEVTVYSDLLRFCHYCPEITLLYLPVGLAFGHQLRQLVEPCVACRYLQNSTALL